ncbi:hypothetical protein HDU67_008814 [Dinochytrium kinnereticum]|nr:hypothetical protein HDU67_008814 [Dinochytrium kinnereticum]
MDSPATFPYQFHKAPTDPAVLEEAPSEDKQHRIHLSRKEKQTDWETEAISTVPLPTHNGPSKILSMVHIHDAKDRNRGGDLWSLVRQDFHLSSVFRDLDSCSNAANEKEKGEEITGCEEDAKDDGQG